MFKVSNRIRRIAAAAAVAMAMATTMVTTANQASAESAWGPVYLVNEATFGYCLATDFSGSVTSWPGCDGPQRWEFVDASPGWLLRNEATDRCLMQHNWTVVVSAVCNPSMAEFHWQFTNNYLWSWNTGGYLVTNFNGEVYLHNRDLPVNQRWAVRI